VTTALILVEDGESWVIHEMLVELLELLQRVLVVLTSTLCQDIHPEVSIGDVLLVQILVRS